MDGFSLDMFARNFHNNVEPEVRKHLKNVYSTFTLALGAAALGSYVHMFSTLLGAGLMTALGALGFLIALMATPFDGKNQAMRLGFVGGFAFLSGVNMGPLLNMAVEINPQLILQALLGTSIIFACFALTALMAPRGYYLFLGGTLFSMLSMICFMSLMNIFMGSMLLFQANIYLGLLVMCGFVVFDTQMIMEKCRRGDKDYILHSVDLFIDFVGIFKRLLVIFMDKDVDLKKKKRN